MPKLKRSSFVVLAVCVGVPVIPLLLSRVTPDPPAPIRCDHRVAENFSLDTDGKWKCRSCGRSLPTRGC